MLAKQLRPQDNIGIVTYGGGRQGVDRIGHRGRWQEDQSAIEGLTAGGHTPGAAGIKTAYDLAAKNFIKGGNNRVKARTMRPACWRQQRPELISLIEKKRRRGFISQPLAWALATIKTTR